MSTVHGHKTDNRCGNDAVEHDFGCKHVSDGSGHFARVVDAISTYCEASAIRFLCLRTDCEDKLAVGEVLVAFDGNVCLCNGPDHVSTFDAAAHALGEASVVKGEMLNELAIVEHFTH